MSARALLALFCFWGLPLLTAQGTPFYSVGAGSACDTCHIEPLGWKNPPIKERKCTLDCKGCHVSPTGGGLRTPSGRFYGQEVVVALGKRPGDEADPMRYLPKGFPSEGKYSLQDGFSGWWPGKIDHRTIEERYGDINATPRLQAGADLRLMALTEKTGGQSNSAVFPMQAQLYLAAHPTQKLTIAADLGVRGSQTNFAGAAPSDFFWLKELFVMKSELPFNAYLRAGRFTLPFGWRVPDHTAFIRNGFFDQFRQGYGVEVGLAPNEAWGNLALWRQGLPGWPGDFSPGGIGLTAQGGLRRLGYQLGGSVHAMKADEGGQNELAAGPMWGVNLNPFVYLGELDMRSLTLGEARTNSLATYHEVRYQALRGITPSLRWEAEIQDLVDPAGSVLQRVQAGVLWDVYRYVQLESDLRVTFGPLTQEVTGFIQLHLWIR